MNMATFPLARVLDLCRRVLRAMVEAAVYAGTAEGRRPADRGRDRRRRATSGALQLRVASKKTPPPVATASRPAGVPHLTSSQNVPAPLLTHGADVTISPVPNAYSGT